LQDKFDEMYGPGLAVSDYHLDMFSGFTAFSGIIPLRSNKPALKKPSLARREEGLLWFISGFTDAEGCFMIKITPKPKSKILVGWQVIPVFQILLHQRDKELLDLIKDCLGVGRVTKVGKQYAFTVSSLAQILKIINHFEKFPLITQKKADFDLFKRIVIIMSRNGHLTCEGLQEIVNIRASLNKGLTDGLKAAFPMTTPVARPLVTGQTVPHPEWLAGFTTGEGCFFVNVHKSSTTKTGFQIRLLFDLVQHSRDNELIRSFIEYFKCGIFYSPKGSMAGRFQVSNFSDIVDKILPFFQKHKIMGEKGKDFSDFCEAAELMKAKKHLTKEGSDQIKKIKKGMNQGRKSINI